ncbi:MAG: hypothetical protein E5X48_21635 [Mesorhizobium sp.]|uniref:tyrosine-type recombinase/integrase n=2 Tax=Phyllobacteriaceae TaxID=69277 RepID=UPI000FE38D9C|nr:MULTISPECIES: tyrosine-type recombinase/integrase [Mesorhizobium]MCF6117519.1 tyrosine-type recombinase/integrase [Mesorhizobium muleiense]RWF01228.1 MAG: hypothetical protein EOS43_10895 [Mesorhizobium sp.]RWG86166.1 MAG: hypothetical protein EOQ70_16160 [Mesorhizobium sp.]RWK08452.1 MAG: hypothetical protein EOR39_20155 [Mesorhizobium sp.]RWK17587.1 MAG: hypothetical protein EOR41_15840 [Mesorhizobium sp.]
MPNWRLSGVANRRNGSSRFPREGLENPALIVKRKRVVNDAELAAIWTGCEPEPGDIGYSFGSIVKLLMLTGQRRTEVAAMRWSELNLEAGTWDLSADRTKNEEPTLIPLSTLAVSVPQSVPKTNDTFVFPARGNGFGELDPSRSAQDARDKFRQAAGIATRHRAHTESQGSVPDRHRRNLQSLYLRQGEARGVAIRCDLTTSAIAISNGSR